MIQTTLTPSQQLPNNPSQDGGKEAAERKVTSGEIKTAKSIGKVVSFGLSLIGKTRYVFGGGRSVSDIAKGTFDCSSFIHHAFAQNGIDLGPVASVSTETLKHKGTAVNANDLQVGDLVFFDTYKKDGHVGIYLGNGEFVGAQSSTGVAVANMNDSYWKSRFTGNVRRVA